MGQHQHQQKQKQEELTRQCYRNFVESIKTAKTRKNYIQSLQYYMKYLGLGKDDYGSLLLDDHKLIQSNIIDFTIWCRDTKQLSPSTISGNTAAIRKFYEMNDIELRWKRIKGYQGEFYRTVEDRAYTHDEIKRMADIANIRDKAIILFMASTGIRVGAVGPLRMRDLTEIPEYNILKIVVYARFPKDRYFCLCTPEAKSALKSYISFRRDICGERITDDSPLFRREFDKENSEQVAKPEPVTKTAIYSAIWELLQKTGIRPIQRQTQEERAARKPPKRTELQACHALRKFTVTNMIRAKMDFNIRSKLTGHKVQGMDPSYDRREESEYIQEYVDKGIDFLTISAENKLRRELEHYKVKASQFDSLRAEIDELKELIGSK